MQLKGTIHLISHHSVVSLKTISQSKSLTNHTLHTINSNLHNNIPIIIMMVVPVFTLSISQSVSQSFNCPFLIIQWQYKIQYNLLKTCRKEYYDNSFKSVAYSSCEYILYKIYTRTSTQQIVCKVCLALYVRVAEKCSSSALINLLWHLFSDILESFFFLLILRLWTTFTQIMSCQLPS